jgi:ketosteroid isomerase-like protein
MAGVLTIASAHVEVQTAPTDPGAERAIHQLEQDWEQALLKNDQTTIDRIVARDCLFVSSTGELMTKTQADSDRRSSALQASTTTQTIIRVLGDTAIVIGTNLETSQYAGQDTSGQYRWTDVFVKRDGQWQVVSAQSTRIEGPILAERPLPPPNPGRAASPDPNQSVEGLSQDQVRARLGSPNLTSTAPDGVTTWYYDTDKGTVRVYFYRGLASLRRQK